MKLLKSTFLLTVLMSMVGLQAFADFDTSTKVLVGDLYYYLDNKNSQAQVTSMPSGKYTGDITIPSSVTYDEKAYSVTSVGQRAFYNCSALTSVTIPNSVTSIGYYAFSGCSDLTSVTIPNSVTSIGAGAFNYCSGLTSITIGNSVTSIGGSAFSYCSGLTSVTIPNSVTSIEYAAFQNCSSLTSVTIGNSVTSIGNYAFKSCSSLTSITIPNSVTNIDSWAFSNCPSLTSINVDSGNKWFDSRDNCNAIIRTQINTLIYGCKNTTIPNSVTTIENCAFEGCTNLTSIAIPNCITSIGSSAFSYCSRLTSVIIPNSVTDIGAGIFSGCTSLTSINVESGNIKYDSRDNCNAIIETSSNTLIAGCRNTTIPNSVTSIGDYAFSDCSGLTSITIPNSVTSIGDYAFQDCSGLTSVTIPNSVTSIGRNTFYNCSGLTSINIPNSVTSIGDKAFQGCSGLTSINIPNSVTSIGQEAFYGCSGLTSVTVDLNTPLAIEQYTFTNRSNSTLYVPYGCKAAYEATDYWKDFKEIIEMAAPSPTIAFADANVKAICVANWDTNGDGELSEAEAAAVTDLGIVFKNNLNITSFNELQYFTGLTSIGSTAFYGCSGLTSIIIPNSVTSIGSNAFYRCSGLTSVTIGNSVTSIGSKAFDYCSYLKKVIISDIAAWCGISFGNVQANPLYYAHHLYSDKNTEITDLVIPDGVTSIGQYAFEGCSGLTSLTIPNSVTSISIGGSAFANCSGLTSITIGSGVTSISIESSAFANCSGLTSVSVDTGNTKYDSRDNCNAIIETANNRLIVGCKNTVIPNSVTSIGERAFSGCSDLTSITIPNSVTSIGENAFNGCSGLTSITIPNSVTYIGGAAFGSCSGLTSFRFPNRLKTLSVNVIGDSGVTSIIIPGSVDTIEQGAFVSCQQLKDVYCLATNVPKTNSLTFYNLNTKNVTLHVYSEYVSAYSSAAVWNTLKEVVAFTPDELITLAADDPTIKVKVGDLYYNIDVNNNIAAVTFLKGKTYVSNIVIPATISCGNSVFDVTSIGGAAFYECSGLTSITIPNSVKSIGSQAFNYCSGLTSVTIPNSVTSIGERAFRDCTGLTSITIPNSVTDIGSSAFYGCSGLTSVSVEAGNTMYDSRDNCNAIIETATNRLMYGSNNTVIPNGVTSIGSGAFYGCSGLTSVTIPNSVTSIGEAAFWQCSGLTSITIGNSVTSIGGSAFYECTGLTSITIGNSVTSIGNYAFYDCSGLTKVIVSDIAAWCGISFGNVQANPLYYAHHLYSNVNTEITDLIIPDDVMSIGDNAFCGCYGLSSVTIPNSVTSIGEAAFRYCYGLTSVTVDINTPLAIEQYTFSNRANATLYVPAGCKAAYEAADYWKEFKEIVEMAAPSPTIEFADANVKAICVEHWDTDGDGELSLDEAAAVTTVSDYFKNNTTITSFDEFAYFTGLTSIGNSAFEGCSGLNSVNIPNSVTSIGNAAFHSCSGLTSITIPNSVTSIGTYAFYECSELNSVTIGNSVTSIGESTFYGCSSLNSFTIPNSVTSIGPAAFYGCSGLTSINIPNSVTSISSGQAFAGCSSLTSMIVESGNTKYDSRDNCNAIIKTESNTLISGCKNTVIPNSVTSIGEFAFGGCYDLTSINIPNSVTSIDNFAFIGCSALTSIIIPNSVTSIGHAAFSGCSGLTSINIPNSVTSIGTTAFGSCSGLESVTIPNSVTSIGEYTFSDCSGLTSITIPNSVTSIDSRAFDGCTGLTSVTVDISTPLSISSNTFINRANATLYVPAGCKAAYEAADYWKEFKEIVEMAAPSPTIAFADANVKAICVEHWDTDGDGELSLDEAAAVTTVSDYFKNNTTITSFDEFAYFTGVTSIDILAFDGCSQLASITLPEGLTTICGGAFRGCALTSIAIPSTVTGIDGSFLANCDAIAQITVDNGNTTYDSRNNCNAIITSNDNDEPNMLVTGCKNTSIPNTVTKIGNYAFYGCTGLTSITIPSSVTWIQGGAFHGCSGLTSITIPSSVTFIDNNINIFGKCDALTSITVENGNTKYDSRNSCNAIIETSTNTLVSACNNTVIPNDITSIGQCAFEDCTEMTSITIPNSVTRIDFAAFRGCSGLTSIAIPNSVTSIGWYAFDGCSSLTSVTIDINTPLTIKDETFSNRANATLYVPADCKSAYEAADYWKEFKEIVEMAPEYPDYVTIAMKTGSGASRSMIAYSSKYGLDFTDRPEIKAYIACGYNWKKQVMLVHVKVVPPYTGMVIKTSNAIYDGGEYDVPTTTEDYYYANLLVPVVEKQTVTPTETIDDVEYTNFAIGTLTGGGIGFVRLASNWTAQNKSYLRVPTSLYNNTAGARELGGFDIEFVEGELATDILNAHRNGRQNDGDYYDIQGRKVKPISKGLYIHNGKKVLVK